MFNKRQQKKEKITFEQKISLIDQKRCEDFAIYKKAKLVCLHKAKEKKNIMFDKKISKYINNNNLKNKYIKEKEIMNIMMDKKIHKLENKEFRLYEKTFSYKIAKWFHGVGKEFLRISWVNRSHVIYIFFVVLLIVLFLSIIFYGLDAIIIPYGPKSK